MTGEDDGSMLRVELRPHAQAHLVGLPAQQLRVDRPHEGVHAIEAFGRWARHQPFEITVRTRDVTIRAGRDVDDDVSALRHEYLPSGAYQSSTRSARNVVQRFGAPTVP